VGRRSTFDGNSLGQTPIANLLMTIGSQRRRLPGIRSSASGRQTVRRDVERAEPDRGRSHQVSFGTSVLWERGMKAVRSHRSGHPGGWEPGSGRRIRCAMRRICTASASYEAALSTLTRFERPPSRGAPDVRRQAEELSRVSASSRWGGPGGSRVGRGRHHQEGPVRGSSIRRTRHRAWRRLFTNVRKRLLPSLIRERVRTARSGLDRKDYPARRTRR